ncbi:GatB/YqeY domain-containing protein [Mycolicibacterium stellerae]|uniref:GatB/YqeY domain-containing protein n=1 Tax=Mycolicibacterium stellerae TaxID=2358193 RepID=UPI001F22BD55|nr:GatB/YqeY domain-containing protein [Mycolicibacterium stellerae]
MSPLPAETWRTLVRASLLAARKKRDSTRATALRSVLSAIDNAETPETVVPPGRASGAIAGAVAGLGSTEVTRRELSEEQIRDLVRSEIAERRSAADQFTAGGHAERAAALRAEMAVLADLLGDV